MNEGSGMIVDAALWVHQQPGPGLLESVYQAVLADRPAEMGMQVERQRAIPIRSGGALLKGNIERIAAGNVPDLNTSSVPFELSV